MTTSSMEDKFGGVQKWLMIGGVILLVIWGAVKILGLG